MPRLATILKRKNEDPTQDYTTTEIEGQNHKYTIPYTKANVAKLKTDFSKRCNFYAKHDGKTYPITAEEFKNSSLTSWYRCMSLQQGRLGMQLLNCKVLSPANDQKATGRWDRHDAAG